MLVIDVPLECALLEMRSDASDEGFGCCSHILYVSKNLKAFLTGKFIYYMEALEGVLVPDEVVGPDEILSLHVLLVDYKSEVIVGLCALTYGEDDAS